MFQLNINQSSYDRTTDDETDRVENRTMDNHLADFL